MARTCEWLFMLAVFALLALSCGSGDAVAPGSAERADLSLNSGAPGNPAKEDRAGRWVWGAFDIFLEPETGAAEIVPRRWVSGHLNALRFLEEAPCSSCLQVTNAVNVGPKEWLVDVRLRHPFVGLDRYTGFDVRGTVMLDGSYTFPGSGLSCPDPLEPSGGALLNPDGYTTLFNPTDYPPGSAAWRAWEYQKGRRATPLFPDATLNPYKCYRITAPRRYFGCTEIETLTYHIRFPQSGPLRFGYAVDANWAPPSEDQPVVPDDFPITANVPEAYQLGFEATANTLWCDSTGGGGGDIRFKLRVYDHQDAHLVADGGTVKGFTWEIPGMTGWDAIVPFGWQEGVDSAGAYVAYEFVEAPVPDIPGTHRCLIGVVDSEDGLLGENDIAFHLTEVEIAPGETCWSPEELIADRPSEDFRAHLMNARCTYIDQDGVFHLFYVDYSWAIHHLTIDGGVNDEVILPGERGFNINAVPDDSGAVHMVYSDDPPNLGGNVVYRLITPEGEIGPPVALTASSGPKQFENALAIAPDGDILVLWNNSQIQPNRRLCGAYWNGSNWTPEMILRVCYLPDGWTNHTLMADSSGVFHILYDEGEPLDLYYMWFDNGALSEPEPLVIGPWRSAAPVMSIDSQDRLYATFQDRRMVSIRGFLIMRDPITGEWSPEIDLIGHNYDTNRFQNRPLPDGRLAVVWTDWRDRTRGLYSKVFDPFLPEDVIQAIPDDEIAAQYDASKNQTRLCMSPGGTLHLVWSDARAGYWQLFYSTCTP